MFSQIDDGQNYLLGTGIDDQIANIVQAQLLFLESADASKDIQIYLNSWRKCL
jgi:ATP-dependent Clp protease protease subunit